MSEQDLKQANKTLGIDDTLPVIFIYTAPKVGSTSIVSTLRVFAHKKAHTIHIHDNTMLQVLTGISNVSVNDIIKYNGKIGRKIYVIDIYRNPIEHKISYFFETISYHFNNSLSEIKKYPLERISERFNQIFPYLATQNKFMHAYNLPKSLIPTSFDHQKGFMLIELDGVKYISLRLCDSRQWGEILSRILNISVRLHFIFEEYKTSEKDEIGKLYKSFVSTYTIPENIFNDLVCTDRDAQYFMSDVERVSYINKWKSKTCTPYSYFTQEQNIMYERVSAVNCQYNEIKTNHYIDDGCGCDACIAKRQEIIKKIKNSTYNGESNHHINSRNEFISHKVKKANIELMHRIEEAKQKQMMVKNKKPVTQIMANIVR